MSNGVGVLANALQSYLARKHAGGMLEAQQANQAQRDATAQEWQNKEWQRDAMRREEDMARALEQQAWSRNWQQQQAASRMAERDQDAARDAARDEARMAFDRERLEAEKGWHAAQTQAQKDIAKGNQDTRRATAPRPGAGRSGAGGTPRNDDTPHKVWAKDLDTATAELKGLVANPYQKGAAERMEYLRKYIDGLRALEPPPDQGAPAAPTQGPAQQPAPTPAPTGKKRAL